MTVPLLDLQAQYRPLREPLLEALARVADSQRFIMGPEVEAFEREVADVIDVRHAIGVSSGTDALLAALMALDIGPGDEVVTSTFSFFATAGSIARVGARPVLVDIDPETFNMDVVAAARACTAKTRALMPVHLFGQAADMSAVLALADEYTLKVIEDAAQAIGASDHGGRVGGIGNLGCFSFFPSKNLGGFGDGGLVTTNDDRLAHKVRLLRNHGMEPKYFHALVGGNFRLDAIQAAVLRVKLPHLAGWTEGRRANAARYRQLFTDAGLTDTVGLPSERPDRHHIYNQFVVRVPDRDRLKSHLDQQGSAPKSTTRCPSTCRPASRTWATRPATSRTPSGRRPRSSHSRSIPNSHRISRPSSSSRSARSIDRAPDGRYPKRRPGASHGTRHTAPTDPRPTTPETHANKRRFHMDLKQRLEAKEAVAGIIGLGYVGLPLAVELARNNVRTIGFDVDVRKVSELAAGRSYIPDVPSEHVAEAVNAGMLIPTTDAASLADADVIDICVPTPLRKTKDPDLSYVVKAVETTAAVLRKGQLIILESTTYPGTTDEVVKPALEAKGLKAGVDFYLAFSPERVDPGNPTYHTKNIPKVVGGLDAGSTQVAEAFYRQVVDTVVPVSSTRSAEMVKPSRTPSAPSTSAWPTSSRSCATAWASTCGGHRRRQDQAVRLHALLPGAWPGGHCIPIDPFYLSWKAKQFNFEARFIELAGQVNGSMPEHVVTRVAEALNAHRKPLNGSKVHVLGVAYKRDIDDVRESPALDVIELLMRRGATVTYSIRYVPEVDHGPHQMKAVSVDAAIATDPDCAVIITDHKVFDYPRIVASFPLIVDTRNALKGVTSEKIFGL
ncbi:MAG: nucleotide sugar dehydrogenase [Vicinamibacterales bacterium]